MTIYKYFSHHSGLFILPFLIVPIGIHILVKQFLLLKPKIKHFIDPDLEYYNKKKERFIHAMLMVLSLSQFALEVSYGVTGIQMLNFCAEILDGLYVGIERRQNRL